MNLTDYISLLENPNSIENEQVLSLEKILEEFPYFQSARVLLLKSLYNQDSFKYNQALKVTAVHTTDRSILFNFITSDYFITIKDHPILEIEGVFSKPDDTTETHTKKDFSSDEMKDEFLTSKVEFFSKKTAHSNNEIIIEEDKIESTANYGLEESIKNTIKESSHIMEKELIIDSKNTQTPSIEKKLTIRRPLELLKNEKYSFQEWLQLANFHQENEIKETFLEELNPERQKKIDLIDQFIENNPKIVASKTSTINIYIPEKNSQDSTHLMTETLAKVYLEQKKYQKAIQAYKILILKYPEKSTFFADRIDDIKTLQQNNN